MSNSIIIYAIYIYIYILYMLSSYLLMSVVSLFNQATSCFNISNLLVLIFMMFYYIITPTIYSTMLNTPLKQTFYSRGVSFSQSPRSISSNLSVHTCITIFLQCLLHSPVSYPSMIILRSTLVKSFLVNLKFIFCSLLSFCCL